LEPPFTCQQEKYENLSSLIIVTSTVSKNYLANLATNLPTNCKAGIARSNTPYDGMHHNQRVKPTNTGAPYFFLKEWITVPLFKVAVAQIMQE